MIKCKICEVEFNSIASLGKHITRTHKLDKEQYYNTYLSENGAGVCYCGNKTKFRNLSVGYLQYCSSKCSYHSPEVKEKRDNTNLRKYGTTNVNESDAVKDKRKATVRSRYGVDHITQLDQVKDKIKETNLSRYGTENVMGNADIRANYKASMLKKYGVDHPIKNEVIKERRTLTNIERYGVTHPMKLDEIKDKQRETCLRTYGEAYPIKLDKVKETRIKTNLDRYGVEYPIQRNDIYQKARESMIEKYGVPFSAQCKDSLNKRINTNKVRYNVEHVTQSEYVKEKIKHTNLVRYGNENPMQNHSIYLKSVESHLDKYGYKYAFHNDTARDTRKTNSLNRMKDKYSDQLSKYNCDLLSFNSNSTFTYKCNKCKNIMDESWQFVVICRFNNNITPCTECHPKEQKVSYMEKAILDYVNELSDDEVLANNRSVISPYELDVYIPKKRLAFEFNGLYYHNELNKPNDYHITKTNICELNNVHLIHIYEDDWVYKSEIVKSRIRNLLGKSNVIYARKCIVKEVPIKIANAFLDINHIQGKARSKYKYGLYYNGELVSLMTFGKSRFSDEFELIRFCNKLNTSVVGGASKIFKHFVNTHNIDSIISYADRSWSTGNLYTQLGFTFHSYTQPGYYYINGNIRENRIKYQKHKLVNAGYDKTKTEHQIMLERKLYRIYDSGNMKFLWKR
jgi:hypothetical protein